MTRLALLLTGVLVFSACGKVNAQEASQGTGREGSLE